MLLFPFHVRHSFAREKEALFFLSLTTRQRATEKCYLHNHHTLRMGFERVSCLAKTSVTHWDSSIFISQVYRLVHTHTLHPSACLLLNKSNQQYETDIICGLWHILTLTSLFSYSAVNRFFFFRIILTDGDSANLSSNPSFPFLFYKPPSPPVCLSVFTHWLVFMSILLNSHIFHGSPPGFGVIWIVSRKRIQMDCDRKRIICSHRHQNK